jgi:hypothetical protein
MLLTTFEPENRLVAGELERRWNQVQRVGEIETRIEQHLESLRWARSQGFAGGVRRLGPAPANSLG